MSWSWHKDDFYWFWSQEVRGQGHIQTSDFALFRHNNYYLLTYDDDTWRMWCMWPKGHPYLLGIKRSKVKVRFSVWTLHHFRTVILTFNSVLHTRLYCQWPEEDSQKLIWGSKGQGQTLNVWICCDGGICPFRTGLRESRTKFDLLNSMLLFVLWCPGERHRPTLTLCLINLETSLSNLWFYVEKQNLNKFHLTFAIKSDEA